ncbi:Nucleic-acid-binding protein from transposon X-element [Araneus ventricosus]|uniref:Nucleic-acid-binding protein from transposon X-element n=1 Tax=Araneus ventricosus TaxID=182803 RepID=A0A4Y2JJB1_ARAVE|nr:Nucleic-acid-binding protein from transposon X-element [Araneus ventricosus]
MSEDGRSRSTLSSSSIALSNFYNSTLSSPISPAHMQFNSPELNKDQKIEDPIIKFTENWVKSSRNLPKSICQFCHEISLREATIDKNQAFAQSCRKVINDLQMEGGNAAIISSRQNELLNYEKKIEECEAVLISIGPCPVMNCQKHHETRKEDAMDTETGQYGVHNSEFKVVSPKKAAKNSIAQTKSPIKTAKKFEELSNLEETKPQIPAINLKLDANYNLTLQEIHSMFPETENNLVKGYISIQANSEENRLKIIDLLRKNNKEFVLSEAQIDRPLKIVIKRLPIDQDNKELKTILESKGFKILRISQLKNYRQKTLYPYFLVDVAKNENYLKIYNVKTIKHLNVKIESFKKKNCVTICFKCSDFHHSAKNCQCNPRCIKCAGVHETRDCSIKNRIENPICINCNGECHLASWRGCPKFPKINYYPSKPTYAQKLKSNIPNPNNPTNLENPSEPLTTNQDMSDFQAIASALKTVKAALKEFPNLLEISKALNKTKDKFERLNLLLKLIE